MQDSAQIPASGTAELVTRARSGDGSAYRELLARLAPAVRAYARRRLGQREAHEPALLDRARLEDCLSLLTGKAQLVLRGSFFDEASDARQETRPPRLTRFELRSWDGH